MSYERKKASFIKHRVYVTQQPEERTHTAPTLFLVILWLTCRMASAGDSAVWMALTVGPVRPRHKTDVV